MPLAVFSRIGSRSSTRIGPEGAAFHDEFVRLAETHPSLTYLPTMTQPDKARFPWTGECRYVNAAFLRDRVGDSRRPSSTWPGPPGLVGAVTKALAEANADLSAPAV